MFERLMELDDSVAPPGANLLFQRVITNLPEGGSNPAGPFLILAFNL